VHTTRVRESRKKGDCAGIIRVRMHARAKSVEMYSKQPGVLKFLNCSLPRFKECSFHRCIEDSLVFLRHRSEHRSEL